MNTVSRSQKKAQRHTRPAQRVARRGTSNRPSKRRGLPLQRNLTIPRARLAEFCRRWQITELALYGSVLRDDFSPDSDVDILVSFAPAAHPTLLDLARMQSELKAILRREVDLLTRRGIETSRNPIRRQAILSSAETVYVA